MDPQRFDSISKRLGNRLSRRGALRAGAGAALGVVALGKLAPAIAQDPDTTVKDRFISVRTYPYTGTIADAREGLLDLVPLMEQQAGFISIDFVGGDKEIHIVAAFLDKTTAVAASKVEDAWIAENAEDILAGRPEINSGTVFLRSELNSGCGCTTGTFDPCGSDRLICCGTTDLPGGPGICLNTATICPAGEPVAVPTPIPAPTEIPACTSEGCECATGTEAPCDEGLFCCGSDPTLLGGPGICLPACEEEIPAPCTWEGCWCPEGSEGTCDDGLICCGTGDGNGVCAWDCGGGGCTGEGCACLGGVEGSCDPGLECCADFPGGEGTCQFWCGGACTGLGCECTAGTEGACDPGLECCGASVPGGSGICQEACG